MRLAHSALALFLTLALAACGNGGDEGDKAPTGDGGGPGSAERKPIDPALTGSVKGTIRIEGDVPPMPVIDAMAKDPKCHEEVKSETVVANPNGTLRDVIVSVDRRGLTGWAMPGPKAETVQLDQKGCMFSPHILALQVGQTISITNSDKTKHNVNYKSNKNGLLNEIQDVGDAAIEVQAKFAESFSAKCDIHDWMNANIEIFDHPFFAVSDETGAYEISGLPEGTYTITVKHGYYESAPQKVTIKAGETATLDFTFQAD